MVSTGRYLICKHQPMLTVFFLAILLLTTAQVTMSYGESLYWSEAGWSQDSPQRFQASKNTETDSEIRIFNVKYYPVGSIADKIDKLFAPKVIIKDRLRHTIMIRDTKEKCDNIADFIANIDTKPSIILVEGTIIKIDVNKAFSLGAKFEHSNSFGDSKSSSSSEPQQLELKYNLLSSIPSYLPEFAVSIVSDSGVKHDISLNALLNEGAGEVVLKPHISFISGTRGSFKQETNVPAVTASENGTSVSKETVGLSLEVEGYHVPSQEKNEQDKIYLTRLKLTDGTVGDQVVGGGGQQQIAFFTTDLILETTQLVEAGELIILGGAITRDESEKISKVPILGDIPLVKYLFRHTSTEEQRLEMLAFIRLSIIEKDSYAFKAAQYKESQHLHPLEFGGESNESISEHPLSAAKWSSKIIYEEDMYFDLVHNRISAEHQAKAKEAFKDHIRSRIKLTFKWGDMPLVKRHIFSDPGLDNEFRHQSMVMQMTPLEIIIIARHLGALNDNVFKIYYDYLKEKNILKYRATGDK